MAFIAVISILSYSEEVHRAFTSSLTFQKQDFTQKIFNIHAPTAGIQSKTFNEQW
jgi:hypothetical protein